MSHEQFQSCIDACVRCAQECEHCAAACLQEDDVKILARCIKLDADCGKICWSAAGHMSRGSKFAQEICRVCADICEACGEECNKHGMDHCQRCAEPCFKCTEECRCMAGVAA